MIFHLLIRYLMWELPQSAYGDGQIKEKRLATFFLFKTQRRLSEDNQTANSRHISISAKHKSCKLSVFRCQHGPFLVWQTPYYLVKPWAQLTTDKYIFEVFHYWALKGTQKGTNIHQPASPTWRRTHYKLLRSEFYFIMCGQKWMKSIKN